MNKGEERKVKNRNVGDKCIKRVNTEEETGIYIFSPFQLFSIFSKRRFNESLWRICV